jgi:parallel beta-helix repeat protein
MIYSAYCIFLNNNVKENSEGIVMSTSHNVIYHNNFIRNGKQVLPVNQYANTWDNGYPSGGNYWSDYTGLDSYWGPDQNLIGSDGIGDTHYAIGAKNHDRYPLMNPYTLPDVAVVEIAASKTVAERGCVLTIVVTVENQANKVEFSSVTLYINAVAFASKTVMLASGRTAVVFEWNTTSCAIGAYTIAALVTPVRNEEDTADNGLTYGSIVVSIAGDVDGDFNVDLVDIVGITCIYGYQIGNAHFKANSDLDGDGIIGIFDVVKCVRHYGQRCP